MISQNAASRQTKYCTEIVRSLNQLGHASNADLLRQLQSKYPNLSATTVHRATARLASRGEIAVAPPDKAGALRYDTTVKAHDHFLCGNCDQLRDIDVLQQVSHILKQTLKNCEPSGRLTICGICKVCSTKKGTL